MIGEFGLQDFFMVDSNVKVGYGCGLKKNLIYQLGKPASNLYFLVGIVLRLGRAQWVDSRSSLPGAETGSGLKK